MDLKSEIDLKNLRTFPSLTILPQRFLFPWRALKDKKYFKVPFLIKWISDARISDTVIGLGKNTWVPVSLSNNTDFWMNIKVPV